MTDGLVLASTKTFKALIMEVKSLIACAAREGNPGASEQRSKPCQNEMEFAFANAST